MGLSRLLHPPITTHFLLRTIGVARHTRHHLCTCSNKSQTARQRKSEAVETYVRKYVETHPGSFPKLSHVQKEIGGSWYNLKEFLQNAKEKIFGNFEIKSDSTSDVTSTSAADATVSTVLTTQEKGSEKSDHNELSDTLANTLCHESNIQPKVAPGTSGEILSNMTGDTGLDAKRMYNDLENTGPCKPRKFIQSSAKMNSKDHRLNKEISNVKPEHCSEVPFNATASEEVCDTNVSDLNVDTVKVEGMLNNPNIFQQKKKRMQRRELENAFDKPEKLSSLIYEATRQWQGKVEDEMASTGSTNQVENKMLVDHCDKKVVEPPAAEPENEHLILEEKPSTELVSSKAETTTETLQNVVPTSIPNTLVRIQNQKKGSTLSADKVSKEGGIPASGHGPQKIMRLSALFGKVDYQKAGQFMDKYNILETNGYLENPDKDSSPNVPKPSDVNDFIDCIKGYPLGQQVTSGPGTAMSNETDENHNADPVKVLSQLNMQKSDDKGRQTSSSHILDRKSVEPSVEAPVKIAYKNGKIESQEKGNAENVVLNANIPPMRMRHLDNARDRTCGESLDQFKVIVKFVHKDAGEQDLIDVLKRFDKILKIELSGAGKSFFKTATVYFKTLAGMQIALQTPDLNLKGCVISLEAASSLKSQSKNITIPSLIGDPDAPPALVKNPMRTVAIKQLTHKICPRHIEEALSFCESNISGFFLGSSDSVAYVEFETEDGKDRALAKQSIVVLGKRMFIYRVDTPRTTVVRIKTIWPDVIPKGHSFKSLGKMKYCSQRSATILDVHFSITEWPNMLQILNKLNGMHVDGVKLIAEPAPVFPSDVLLQIYSQPEERKRIKSNMLRCLQKLEGSAVPKTKVTEIWSKLYGEQ